MKSVFLNLFFGEECMYEPLNILTIVDYLSKKGHEVFIFNEELSDNTICYKYIDEISPDIIFVSAVFQKNKTRIITFLNDFSKRYNIPIFVGGHDVTLRYSQYFKECRCISGIILGPGEVTINELLNCIQQGENWKNIEGIAYRNEGNEIICNKFSKGNRITYNYWIDRRILLQNLSKYGTKIIREAAMLSSRGCCWNCSFCSVNKYNKLLEMRKYEIRSGEDIAKEMKSVQNLTGLKVFSFVDDLFLLHGKKGKERLRELYEFIKKYKISIEAIKICTRVDSIDRENIDLLKKLNVKQIYLGIESFYKYDLERYNKEITSEQIIEALDNLQSYGYKASIDSEYKIIPGSIIFNPWTTIDGLKYNLGLFKRYNFPPKRFVRKLFIYEDTEILNWLKQNNYIISEDLSYNMRPEVEVAYKMCKYVIREVSIVREKIREIEKILTVFNLIIPENLKLFRKEADEFIYSCFEIIIKDNLEQPVMEIIINQMLEEFNTKAREMEYIMESRKNYIDNLISTTVNMDIDIFKKRVLSNEL